MSADTTPKITQEMVKLYDDYTHISLDRRGFMLDLTRIAGSRAAAAMILPLLAANLASAAIVAADDLRLASEVVNWDGAHGAMRGYIVKPEGTMSGAILPGVLVIHENRGLNDHIRDIARRIALEGFVALAPDFLSPMGGTPTNEDKSREMIGKLDARELGENLVASAEYLRDQSFQTVNGLGAVGFCWGGGAVLRLAVDDPDMEAVVAYYGQQPPAEDVPSIKAKLLLHYAGLDDRIDAGIPAFRAAMDRAGTDYKLFVYDGVNHAFNNDTSAARYDKKAAQLAWERTIAFLKDTLGQS